MLGREFESWCSHMNWDFSSQEKKKKLNKWRTINSLVLYTKIDFTDDEGKEWLNPLREKN